MKIQDMSCSQEEVVKGWSNNYVTRGRNAMNASHSRSTSPNVVASSTACCLDPHHSTPVHIFSCESPVCLVACCTLTVYCKKLCTLKSCMEPVHHTAACSNLSFDAL